MKRFTLGISLLASLTTLGPGCASSPPNAGFADVTKNVSDRIGQRVVWNQSSDDDRRAAAAVNELLAQPLNAERATQIALLNNPTLQATYEDLGVAQADLVQAGLLKNPVFDADAKFLESAGGTIIEISVVQDFLSILQIPMRQKLAAAALERSKLRVTGEIIELAGSAREAFYDHLAAAQRVEMRKTVLAASAASLDIATRLRAAGNITELDLANEKASVTQARLDLATAELDLATTRERVNDLLGLWGAQTNWTVDGRLPEPPETDLPLDDIEERSVAASVDLGSAKQRVAAAAQTLGFKRTFSMLTDAELGVAMEHESEGSWGFGPALSVPIPLFDRGQASVATAQARFRQSQKQLVATAVTVRSAARAARERLLSARERVEYFRKVYLPQRRQITQQTQLQFNAMTVSPFQLLEAKRQEVEAGAGYIDAMHDYWRSRSRVEQLLAGRMPGGASVMKGGDVSGSEPASNGSSRPLGPGVH